MRPIRSKINPLSPQFRDNQVRMRAVLEDYRARMAQALDQGKAKYLERTKAEGKMLARERIELLLDPDSPFMELMPLAGCTRSDINVGGTLVGGIGLVSGKLCLITSNVATVKGGAVDYTTLQKGFRFNEIALENRLPVINLVESAGANLTEQAQIFNFGGAGFREITRRSKLGLTTVSVVFGNSTAGGAYVPGMSDYAIFVKNRAKVFLAGPPLVKMATNEVTDEESLGGADMHARVSGVSDYLALDERDAIRLAREIVDTLPESSTKTFADLEEARPPLYDPEELLGILPEDLRVPYDARELIARIVDGSEFAEFKEHYGNTLVTGFARIHGYPVGILANNGVLFSESANKGAQFIQLCNKQNRPLIFLQNITGFMVGRKYEEGGIIKNGAKLINAVSNSGVPAITVMVGASYGAGNYAMCGRAYQPRFLFSYPHSYIAVMGAEQLAGVMEIIGRNAAEKSGMPYDEEQGEQLKQMFVEQVKKESNAYFATSNLWDDGVIDPRETRNYLGFALSACYNDEVKGTEGYGVFRM
jgi:acetyl-CoA carboxylase carboxyltransferase component